MSKSYKDQNKHNRYTGNGLGPHQEHSPMARATRTKNIPRHVARMACRNNAGKLAGSSIESLYESYDDYLDYDS